MNERGGEVGKGTVEAVVTGEIRSGAVVEGTGIVIGGGGVRGVGVGIRSIGDGEVYGGLMKF